MTGFFEECRDILFQLKKHRMELDEAIPLVEAFVSDRALLSPADALLLRAEEVGWDRAHESATCGHARANYRDPQWGTPEYAGNERCEFCDAVSALQARIESLEANAKVDGLLIASLRDERDIWKERARWMSGSADFGPEGVAYEGFKMQGYVNDPTPEEIAARVEQKRKERTP